MNKKLPLLITLLATSAIAVSVVAISANTNHSKRLFAGEKPNSLSCDYYFDPANGYTSIYEINQALYNGESVASDIKTWGTVTCSFANSSGTTYQYYIQSTDQYGNSAALSLYNVSSGSLKVGSVLTITSGTYSLYNGLTQVSSPAFEVDYDTNPYPVETLETDSSYWNVSTVNEKKVVGAYGPIKTSVSNVTINSTTSGRQANATFADDSPILLFYNSIDAKSAIQAKFESLSGKKVRVTGYSTFYAYNNNFNSSSATLEMLIRNPNDIEEIVANLESISVTNAKTEYFVGDSFVAPTVTANYDDDSHADVSDDATFTGYNLSQPGNQTVTVSYGGKTTTYNITVTAVSVTQITVLNTTTSFFVGDTFELGGTVVADYNNGTYSDVTASATITGYNMSQAGNQTVTVSYGGKSITYDIEVVAVTLSSISVEGQTTSFDVGDAFSFGGVVTAHYNNDDSEDVTASSTFSGYDMSQVGNQTVTVSYGGKTTSYQISVNAIELEHMYMNSSLISVSTQYSNGNYGSSGIYEYYRAVGSNWGSVFCRLLPYTGYDYGEPLPGSIYNTSPIDGIKSLTIQYSTVGDSGEKPYITYGENNYRDGKVYFDFSDSTDEIEIDLSAYDVNYFTINSGDVTLYLESVDIAYSDTTTTHGHSFVYDTQDSYRIEPTVYTGTKVAGSTQVTVPVEINYDEVNETYTVVSSKTYTYYTFDYVESNPSYADDAAMITPTDVSNYYIIFGEFPANYGYSSKRAKLAEVFGSNARLVSQYSRTDGYATAVPWRNQPGKDTPLYYEFDIDVDSTYTTSSRGVGRVVAWTYGFTCYDEYTTCVYTDDHYATFQEFNNFGGFGPRFNSERVIAGRQFNELITLH